MGEKNIGTMLRDSMSEIVIILIVIISMTAVGYSAKFNGRLEMCNELDLFYTHPDCQTCEETGRTWEEGECVIPHKEYNPQDSFKNFKPVGDFNGSIL